MKPFLEKSWPEKPSSEKVPGQRRRKAAPSPQATDDVAGSAVPIEQVAADFVLHSAPGYLLRRLDSRAASLYETYTGQSDLTPRQFGVLLTLYQSGPLPQTELGNRLHLDRSTSGEMLQRMLERKLISRRAHRRDKRAVEIALTPLGRKTLLRTVARASAAQQALLSPLPDYLRPVFLKCLQILAEARSPEKFTPEKPADQAATEGERKRVGETTAERR